MYIITATNEKGKRVDISVPINTKKEAIKFKDLTLKSIKKLGVKSLLKNPRIKKVR